MKDLKSINTRYICQIKLTAGVMMNLPKYIGVLERGGIAMNDMGTKVCRIDEISIVSYKAMSSGCMHVMTQLLAVKSSWRLNKADATFKGPNLQPSSNTTYVGLWRNSQRLCSILSHFDLYNLDLLDAAPLQSRQGFLPFNMIGNSPAEYVFIRVSIFCLHYFPLLVISALVILLLVDHNAHSLILVLQAIAIAEAIFYVLIFLPRYHLCQRRARFPQLHSVEDRKKLFQKGLEHISDPEQYISKWCLNAPLASIWRENVKDFYCWALFNKIGCSPEEDGELEEYADKLEQLLGVKLQAGRGPAKPLRLTLEPVNILYRPLLWYMVSIPIWHRPH